MSHICQTGVVEALDRNCRPGREPVPLHATASLPPHDDHVMLHVPHSEKPPFPMRKTFVHLAIAGAVIASMLGAAYPLTADAGSLKWSIVTSPNATSVQANTLASVSCTSASFCMTAGYFIDSSGYKQTLIEEWDGTSWSILSSPNTLYVPSRDKLLGISCASTTFCMAVGDYYNGSNYQTLVAEWNGTSWSGVTGADTSTTQDNHLTSVSCTSASFCMAAGYSVDSSSYDQTLVEEWTGSAWSIVASPSSSTTQTNLLTSVSCTGTGFCMAAGFNNAPAGIDQSLTEEWGGTSWSTVTSPDTLSTQANVLNGVSCTSPSFCIAVGNYNTGSNTLVVIDQWNGTSWSMVSNSTFNVNTGVNNNLLGVSCQNTAFCMTAGYYVGTSTSDQTLIEEWNGTSWSIATSQNSLPNQINTLNGVSCSTSSSCMAAGYHSSSGSYLPTLIEQYGLFCTQGSLSLSLPASAAFPGVTLNGTTQTTTVPLTFTADDETGSGSGWHVSVTSTTFTNAGNHTLPTSASTVTGVSSVSTLAGSCSAPTNTVTPYPIAVPAAATPPAANAIYSANTGTGEGPVSITLNFAVAVPGSAYTGTYTSTWIVTVSDGP